MDARCISPEDASFSGQTLTEILNRFESFESDDTSIPSAVNSTSCASQAYTVILPTISASMVLTPTHASRDDVEIKQKGRVGRPRTKPAKKKTEWHYHLGGVRHSRVPLSVDVKEVLEVAYVSKIMSKNFRREGQPEKERIAQITGIELEKVQEWFKNRRKKDRHIAHKNSIL